MHRFDDIVSIDNLLLAWREFLRGKRKKPDVQEFSLCLMDNIIQLHRVLANQTYHHGNYHHFRIHDPKPRDIHKAAVRDRLVHHALYRILYPFYHQLFIADSFSCRKTKGTHKALNRFRTFGYRVSQNHTKTCWVLKCDIKHFFANIDHQILFFILRQRIPDPDILWLLREIAGSFYSTRPGVGLPLGNLTSQLLVNIYMDEFDQFVKHELKVKYYLRYADDFVVLSPDKHQLREIVSYMKLFLRKRLKLTMHPDKVSVKTIASGVDFLGWVHFPDHRVLRRATRRRMFRRLRERHEEATVNSYLGLLKHGNTGKLEETILRTARSVGIEVMG